MEHHGAPCWYELSTADPSSSQAFYGPLLGWSFEDSGMPGGGYLLASAQGEMVAALMRPDAPMPEFWLIYYAVADCDATAAKIATLGGTVHRAPEDIPGTGRFAIVTDPQGAAFGLLEPLPGQEGGAFNGAKPGHAHWNELSTSAPEAALGFYAEIFGWTASTAMPMGEMGSYQLFAHQGRDIGAIMRLQCETGEIPPHWQPYFGVASIAASKAKAEALGGQILHGPSEVPGGVFILLGQDPRGAHFALVGPM